MDVGMEARYWFLSIIEQIARQNRGLMTSRFLRTIKRDGIVALIYQLRPEPIYLLDTTWNKITDRLLSGTFPANLDALAKELIARKVLISDPYFDRQELNKVRNQALYSLDRTTILYLMMAQHCNFVCHGCPIPALAKRHGNHLLSFEDAIAGIDLWQRHIRDRPEDNDPYFLIFYGGEPLLNREVLEKLLFYIRKERDKIRLPKELELMVCTNGSLIDEKLSRLFADYDVTVAIGIDGPKDHNDTIRLTIDGSPTSMGIERAISLLIENNVRVVASVTITPMNVDCLGDYPDFLRKLGISQFGFNLMKGKGLIQMLGNRSLEEYCRSAAQGVIFGLVNLTEDGKSFEYQLEKSLAVIREGLSFPLDCTCTGNQLVIQADGQVSNCPFLRLDQGHVRNLPDTFRIGATRVVKKWRNRIPLLHRSFISRRSDEVMLNGGGCAWSSLKLYGYATAKDEVNAIYTKEIMDGLIWAHLPQEQSEAIRQGKIAYWCYRRFGSLSTSGTGSF